MEKRSFAWDENPYTGMLRLSLLSEFVLKAEKIQFGVSHTPGGSSALHAAVQGCRNGIFDRSACEPDSHLKAHVAFAGLFSDLYTTIWPMMVDSTNETSSNAFIACRPGANERRSSSRCGSLEASGTGTGGKSFSDLFMGHGS
jgi:hypothetical protein